MLMKRPAVAARGDLDLLSLDPLQTFSWWICLGVGVFYSALAFRGELSKEGPQIFSKRNARSILGILAIHSAFLFILFGLMLIASYIFGLLPNWLTESFYTHGPPISFLDMTFITAMIAAHYIERRYIYVDSDVDASGPENVCS